MINKTITTYRSAYAGLSRETWLLSLVMLINRSGTMVIPFMSLYLTSPAMGFSIGQAGLVFGFFGAGAFAGAWLGGKLTDKIGFYPVQLFALIGGGILFIVLGQMKSYSLICTITFLLSFVNESFRPANSTAIAFYCKIENRTRSYSLNRLAINLGWAIGGAVGGVLAKYNYQLLFWVDGCTNILAAFLMLAFVRPVNYKPAPVSDKTIERGPSAWSDKIYRNFVLLTALFAACFFQLFTNLSVYFKLQLHFTEPFIGLLMATNGMMIVLVEMVMVYKLEGRRSNTFFIIAGVLLMALTYCMLNVFKFNQALALLMIVVMSFGEMLSMPFMNSYWIGRSRSHNRGQYAALYTMAWSTAQSIGPMAGAQVADRLGFTILWWLVAGLSIFTAIGFYLLQRKAIFEKGL
jgi:predicted MFS family arabinose efflux permease